jgi:hypothetical protein
VKRILSLATTLAFSLVAGFPADAATEVVVPDRILDTRDGTGGHHGRLGSGSTLELSHASTLGSGTVMFNLTATDASSPGHVTAWACGEPRPPTSVLNFEPGRAVPNTVVVKQSARGICLESSQDVHLIADVMANFSGTDAVTGISPSRLVDTRGTGRVDAGTVRRVAIAQIQEIPDHATVAVLNVTAVSPDADGFLSVAPCEAFVASGPPSTSTVNFRAGETVAGSTAVTIADGEVCVYSSVRTHLLVDAFGWAPTAHLRASSPERVLDTRTNTWSNGPAGHNVTVGLRVAGRGGVPNGASGVLLTLTVIADSAGHVTVWPCDEPRPETSILNTWPGAVRSNMVLVSLADASGDVCLRASTIDGAPVHLIADATGWVEGTVDRPSPPPAPSAPGDGQPAPAGSTSSRRFPTLPPGSNLPSGAACASQVRSSPEIRPANVIPNSTRGTGPNGRYPRVDGDFTGTTDEIIQWAACKWGIDEDVVRAQVVKESWWNQSNIGDNGESFGLGQVRRPYHQEAFRDENAVRSSAYNLDYTYAGWRSCYEGNETWLNDFEGTRDYGAGDLWGCVGVWFAGRWYVPGVFVYLDGGSTHGYGDVGVRQHLDRRTWEDPDFLAG